MTKPRRTTPEDTERVARLLRGFTHECVRCSPDPPFSRKSIVRRFMALFTNPFRR